MLMLDSIAVSEGLMSVIKGFEVIEWHEKVSTDHIGQREDTNLEYNVCLIFETLQSLEMKKETRK